MSFDFGFTAMDTAAEPGVGQPAILSEDVQGISRQLESIEKQLATLYFERGSSALDEHRALLKQQISGKLLEVERLIMPLLVNLQNNPEKEYIHWPNRKNIIQNQIDQILTITRSYE